MSLFGDETRELVRHVMIGVHFKDYCTNAGGTYESTKYSMECQIPNKGHILMMKDERGEINSMVVKDSDGNNIIDLNITGKIDCAYTRDLWYVCIARTLTGRTSIHMSPWFDEITVRVRYPRLELTTTHKIPSKQKSY